MKFFAATHIPSLALAIALAFPALASAQSAAELHTQLQQRAQSFFAGTEPGGVVLVTDLCHHDQGWARENCGDLWLGFDPQALAEWAQAAGLLEIASVYLAQRNGFQVQVRLFGPA